MIAFPNAKINIGLNIISRREDGYHNLSSCFLPIDWKDALEIVPAKSFEFRTSGLDIPGNEESNLCVRAYHLLKEDYNISPVHIHLHKVLPMGAGLGGGSADGAFALRLLNDLFELEISQSQLETYAKSLGADCPFFVENKPKLVSGIGEILKPVSLDLSDYSIMVVFPGIHVSTRTAFEGIKPRQPIYDLDDMLRKAPDQWQGVITNDFEETVFAVHPEIGQLKEKLLKLGAVYASMTGTGSAVYGIFGSNADLSKMGLGFKGMLVWAG